jgi:hypothetical protein
MPASGAPDQPARLAATGGLTSAARQLPEPHNPFYILLLVSSLIFVVTALAVALVPALEDKAREAGNPPPPSEFRASLRSGGWVWLLYEVAAIVVFGMLSMGLDRLRRLKRERSAVNNQQ